MSKNTRIRIRNTVWYEQDCLSTGTGTKRPRLVLYLLFIPVPIQYYYLSFLMFRIRPVMIGSVNPDPGSQAGFPVRKEN